MEIIWIAIAIGWISLMLSSSSSTRKGSVPKMKNPPPPPIKEGNCYLDCGATYPSPGPDVICLKCGSSIKRPELPEDRIT
jgi:hypothetical protein